MEWKKENEWILNFALLTKREECLIERVRLCNNITKFSFNPYFLPFNPYFPERSVQRFLKTNLMYIFIFALVCGTLKRFYQGALPPS